MKQQMCLIFAVLTIITVSGNPRIRSEYGNVTDVYGQGDSYEQDECGAAIMRERCSGIIINAFRGSGKGLHSDIQHYCTTIPPFVPCLEANRADYLILLGCQDIVMMVMTQVMTEMNLTPDDIFDISINFLDTVNDIVCSRIDEVVELVECVEKNKREAVRELEQCAMDHLSPVVNMIHHDIPLEQDRSELCGSLYGYGECARDTLVAICEDSTDLLDTALDDVVQGVIGNGLGCEAPTNPLLCGHFGKNDTTGRIMVGAHLFNTFLEQRQPVAFWGIAYLLFQMVWSIVEAFVRSVRNKLRR